MNLREFLSTLSAKDRENFASLCGTSIGFLKLVSYGVRNCSPELAVAIDRESNGLVDCRKLCPSPKIDWAYISKKALCWT